MVLAAIRRSLFGSESPPSMAKPEAIMTTEWAFADDSADGWWTEEVGASER